MNLYFSRKTLAAWLMLALGLAVSLFASYKVRQDMEFESAEQFAFSADQIAETVLERLESYELVLRGGGALLASADKVSREQWRAFVEASQAEAIVPGFQGIGLSVLIPAENLATHVAQVRAEGFPDYEVRPAGSRAVYTSIIYLEPFRGTNLRAFGYDMFSEPVRRAAMESARDTGRATLSGKVRLVQETGVGREQAGTLMYVPIYRNGAPTSTIEERRKALVGWAYSPYRMDDLMTGLLKGWTTAQGKYVGLQIFDGTKPVPEALMFRSVQADQAAGGGAHTEQRIVDFYGNKWLLAFERLPTAPGVGYASAWAVLLAGVSLSCLMFAWLLSLLNTRENANRIAEQLTGSLKEQGEKLKESEFRWRFAVDGAGDGLWDWNVADNTVFYSSRWKELMGMLPEEVGSDLDEWARRVHPDDKERVMSALADHSAGRTAVYASEYRLRSKDGQYKWVLDRGMVVSRGDDGQPLRMIGILTNIDQTRQLQASLLEIRKDLEEAQRIARVGSWQVDVQTGHTQWSPELYRMFGLDPEGPVADFPQQSKFFAPASWERLQAAVAASVESGEPYEVELESVDAGGAHGWMLARGEALRDSAGRVQALRGVAQEITERKRNQIRIENLSRLYAVQSECNRAVVYCATQDALFEKICDTLVRLGGMKMAWVGLADKATQRITPVFSAGLGTDYLDGIEISVDAGVPHGRGATGTAVRENKAIWIGDFRNNPVTAPWQDRASKYGWESSAAIPICRNKEPIGALTFYSGQKGWFDPEIRTLLVEIGSTISFAIDKIDAQATLIESEQRFRCLVEQSIAGAFIMQDEKVAYVNPRTCQILGYPSAESLIGISAQALIAPKDRESVRQQVARLSRGEIRNAELLFSALRKDGSTVEVGVNSSLAHYQSRPALIGLMQDISDRKVAEDQIRRYATQLEHTFMQTVGLATSLSEIRDPYTAGHERRVAEIAIAIGRKMGLGEHRVEGLRVGGYLHDVGKTAIPAEILAKPSRLTAVEYSLIKEHARLGYEVLKEVDFPWPVAQIALQHHERMDGSGYPNGIKGNQILLEARIIAVADIIESMASHRPYRPALGIDKALSEIERGKGTLYDEQVVDICLRMFRDEGYVIPAI